MIIRNAAMRHGRRQLASAMSRAGLVRHITTTTTTTPTDSKAGAADTQWPDLKPEAPSKIFSAVKKKRRDDRPAISLTTNSGHEHQGEAWTQTRSVGGREMTPAEQFAEFERVQRATRSVGTRVEKRYVPMELVANPPGPEDVSLELLMASQTHMGHNKALWNPANARYIYGARQGIHIISLEATAAHLRRAARVVEDVAYRGGLILFVGTRPGQMEIVTRAAELAGACHLFTKWTPGGITNRDVLHAKKEMKVVDGKDKELEGFENFVSTGRPLMPDLVVCLNPLENYTMLYECGLASVPTIGIIDTNTNPTWVSYTIPANDDSLRSVAVIGGVLGRAGERGQKRRLEDAKKGNVAWQTPPMLQTHMQKDISAAIKERKEVMGRMQANLAGFNEEEQKMLQEGEDGAGEAMSEEQLLQVLGEAASEAGGDVAAQEGATAASSDIEASLETAAGHAAALEAELAELKK